MLLCGKSMDDEQMTGLGVLAYIPPKPNAKHQAAVEARARARTPSGVEAKIRGRGEDRADGACQGRDRRAQTPRPDACALTRQAQAATAKLAGEPETLGGVQKGAGQDEVLAVAHAQQRFALHDLLV